MNLALTENELTMSSREIADLLDKRHDSVKRSMERVQSSGAIRLTPSVDVNEQGQSVTSYTVNKRDSYIVVAQLSPEFTAKLVDRWQELEQSTQAAALPNFNNPVEAARAWADEAEQKQVAHKALELAAPKIAFVDKYVESSGAKTFREVCKILGAKENAFREFLTETKVMQKVNGSWIPYQNHKDAGRFVVKTGVANDHDFTQSRFTPKGFEYIAGKWVAFNQLESEVK